MRTSNSEISGDNRIVSREPTNSVLLVDDDVEQLQMFENFLKGEGFDTESVSSAEEALRNMSRQFYDVVVCDLRMPTMNGFEFVQAVRAIRTFPRSAHIPIIMLTAGNRELEAISQEVGADMFCEKRNARVMLPKKIRRLLGS